MAAHSFRSQGDANRQAIVESMQSALGITEAEANARFEDEDWQGLNSTEAARQFEQENLTSGTTRATISVPYEVDQGSSSDDTVVQANVPPGVTPPHVVQGDETGEVKSATDKDEEANLQVTPQAEQDNSLFDHSANPDLSKPSAKVDRKDAKDSEKDAAKAQRDSEKAAQARTTTTTTRVVGDKK